MDQVEYERVLALFRPTDFWRRWPHIDRYLIDIDNWLPTHPLTGEQLLRYMLVGFYTDYRAANHLGSDLDTRPEKWNLDQRPYHRLQEKVVTFNAYFGRPILDSLDYLTIMSGTTYDDFDWFEYGIFAFVIAGHGQPRTSVQNER